MRTSYLLAFATSLSLAAVAHAQIAEPVKPAPLTPPGSNPAPAAKPAKVKLYDESADAKVQIATALARAAKDNKRVLLQWGGNWCGWCTRLHELCQSDKKIARELLYEYEVVHVDTGGPKNKNLDLAKSYGADVAKHGFPFLTILDAHGKPVANQETESLEVKTAAGESQGLDAGHNPDAVLKFLADYHAKPIDAKDLFTKGLAAAKTSNKRVFLHFGAPWCGWCHRFEDWMARPEVAAILAKEFVDLKIDTDRNPGGNDILTTYGKGQHGGIPYFAFTGADGAALIDSLGPTGNIGFPSAPEEIAHFEAMLKKAAKNLTAEDITTLCDSLREKPKKVEAPSSGQ